MNPPAESLFRAAPTSVSAMQAGAIGRLSSVALTHAALYREFSLRGGVHGKAAAFTL